MPNKSLGQHWLFDEPSLRAVADAGQVEAGDTVIEIGPGLGTLSEELLSRGATVTAVEFDSMLAADLQKKFSTEDISIVNEDILQFDFSKFKNFKVVGNIPYYLTSKLIRNLLELKNQPTAIGLLIQKEVAQRIVAEPGKMSILSVAAQFYADCSLGPEVPAGLFTPPPKVDSQIVQLIPQPTRDDIDNKQFFRVVKAGFGERRKKLVNSLSGGLHMPKDHIATIIESLGWGPNVRAQELSVDDWCSLAEKL
ncbi:TPA: ribosomal RNA small subunit methyltransferase A [Candidatus Saccharibacteria bacterium]|nr:ribosomal RNA small subunit methyltransferase A [Candidatus Saccharibacteria bacterium]HIO88058.1 ribosomal RNA small subunit methyltransferase A [Candidatus Saccharibacteria bacterium]